MKNNNKGFSLVELIVVIAIMAILAAIAIPTFAHFITKANEASDAELLHNINYIFNAACLENGVDVSEVGSAKITYSEADDMELVSVVMKNNNTELATKIMDSFELHFGDMKKEKFKSADYKTITALYFSNGEFGTQLVLGATSGSGNYYSYIPDPEQAKKFSNSVFMNEMGVSTTLGIMDKVGNFGMGIIQSGDSEALDIVLKDAGFAKSFAKYLSYTGNMETEADIDAFYTWVDQKYPDADEKAKVQTNALMLYSSEKSTDLTADSLKNLLGGEESAKDQILGNLNTETPDTATAMAQTAAAYSLYMGYLYQLPEDYTEGGQTKAQLIEAAQNNPITVLNGLDDAGFRAYINDPANSNDIDGYLAAMGMLNDASGTKNDNGGTAAGDILNEGFNTTWMEDLLSQTSGN